MADVVALIARLRRREERRAIRPRVFRDRLNPLEMRTDDELYMRYRFRQPTLLFLVDLVAVHIAHPTGRSMSLPPLLQVLIFLRFVATGGFHQLMGDAVNISKATAGRCIRGVADVLVNFRRRFIRFPTGQEADNVKRAFHANAGIPQTLGCIDGTFVRISTPTENEPDYVNRKGFHALNVQMVCDSNFVITNCVAQWPGSCHDSRIFRESQLCQDFENGVHNGFLLGDSGYPCRRYLMTPYNNTHNERHRERFNGALCKTRVLIEQTFGILKRRFTCLSIGLRTNPNRACKYIIACAILHNVGILRQDIVTESINDLTIQGPDIMDQIVHVNENGFRVRENMARNLFG